MLIVLHADLRALGYCNRGARDWFSRHHLDWSAFIHRGIAAEQLLATGDTMAKEVVAVAERRIEAGRIHGR
ncbi:hypothetical protein AB833_17395 [Chromatiales bacterium (ex Bugula neritina AB1)]|nr:hypothetical protein AB833_17395 [Chromatiales bacterium (ex Bugula neritina AB1)]